MSYKTNATELVYNFICERIRQGEWKPGEKIWTEYKLTEELGVSRVAVRQAIDKLVTTSTLKKIQGSGTYVKKNIPIFITSSLSHAITDSDLLDIARFRIFFETGNIELFIKYSSEKDLNELRKIHNKLMSCDKSSDDFYHYDFEFHQQIAYGTKNSFVIQIFTFLNSILIANQEKLHQVLGPDIALKYHPLIFEYIEKGDLAAASLMMRRHMEDTADAFEVYLLKAKESLNNF